MQQERLLRWNGRQGEGKDLCNRYFLQTGEKEKEPGARFKVVMLAQRKQVGARTASRCERSWEVRCRQLPPFQLFESLWDTPFALRKEVLVSQNWQ